jgi:NADH-quinone oxidoreductase subunit I
MSSAMKAARNYLDSIIDSVVSTAIGLRITGRYLLQKPITVQYPDERMRIPNRFRGVHYLEQEKCINCLACAKACPANCIEMEAIKHGKEREWVSFTIDYKKCLFCELCVHPCPTNCIHMGPEYSYVVTDRKDLMHNLLSYRGMSREAKVRMIEAEKKKKAKEAAKKAKEAKAKAEAERKAAEGDAGTEPEKDSKGGEA